MMTFEPYVAKNRRCHDLMFDFLIADETAKLWYDSSPEQYMVERDWCRQHIKPGDTVVDCGGHHGMMSVLFANWVGPKGNVIVYEALPRNAEIVRQNADLNHLDNITVRPLGVGDVNGTTSIELNSGNVVVLNTGGEGKEQISIVTLDDDLAAGIPVDFLKLDVEGSELRAVRGARRTLMKRPIVLLEVHNFLFEDRIATLGQIFREISSAYWTFEVQCEVHSSDWQHVDGPIDLLWLARFDNPHVYCLPRSKARPLYQLFDVGGARIRDLTQTIARRLGYLPQELASQSEPREQYKASQLIRLIQIGANGRAPGLAGTVGQTLPDPEGGLHSEPKQGQPLMLSAIAAVRQNSQHEWITRSRTLPPSADELSNFVTALYTNLFDRRPDSAGLVYWTSEIADNIASLHASQSEENNDHAHAAAKALISIISGAQGADKLSLARKSQGGV